MAMLNNQMVNEMMELPLPCSITSDRFCMFFFPLILQLEATKMLMFSEQTWDLFKTKDQGRGQISWSAFGRPGMFQVVWALDDRWWSLMIVDQVARNGQFLKFMTTLVGHWREEQRITGANAFFAKIGKCSKLVTSHTSDIHCLYGVPLLKDLGSRGYQQPIRLKNVWKSLLSLRLRSLTTWFMDLISDELRSALLVCSLCLSSAEMGRRVRHRHLCWGTYLYPCRSSAGEPTEMEAFFCGTWHILTRPFVRFLNQKKNMF